MSAEVLAACTHVRTAFAAQAGLEWETVLREVNEAWRVGHGAGDRQFARLLPAPGTVGLQDTHTLGETTDVLAFACGLQIGVKAARSPAPPSRREVRVSVTAVDGVPMGTPADDAERRLRRSLGDADSHELPGCDGETGRRLTWGAFTVVLSNEGKGPVVLRGWSLRPGVSRVSYVLPYDVQPGDAIRDVPKRVPGGVGSDGEGPTEGRYGVHTDRVPHLLWTSDDKGRAGKVEEVSYRDFGCD